MAANHALISTQLPTPDGSFIQSCNELVIDNFNGVCITCQFDANSFQQSDFQHLNVARPKQLGNAKRKRLAEFLAGRYAAQIAMRKLNLPNAEIPISANRAPDWPSAVSASISHNEGIALCFMSIGNQKLGIDIEKPLTPEAAIAVASVILSTEENQLIQQLACDFNFGTTLAFSAKECVYKALAASLANPNDPHSYQIQSVNLKSQTLTVVDAQKNSDHNAVVKQAISWRVLGDKILCYTSN